MDNKQLSLTGVTFAPSDKELIEAVVNSKTSKKQKKKEDFSKFDPVTGEKIAEQTNEITPKGFANGLQGNRNINPDLFYNYQKAKMEVQTDAHKDKKSPVDAWEAIGKGTIGTAGGFALGNVFNASAKTKGVMSLGLGALISAMNIKKQKADYNNQMAAREMLLGQHTDRERAYRAAIAKKYHLNGE